MQNSLATIEAIAQQERMRPAHAMLEKAAGKRLVKRAKALLEGASDNDANVLSKIIELRGVQRIVVDAGENVLIRTVGLNLLGFPELLLEISKESIEVARGIVDDLIASCMHGEGRDKVQDGRLVFAVRFDIAYKMTPTTLTESTHGGISLEIAKASAKFMPNNVPNAMQLQVVGDYREGVVVKHSDPLAMWKHEKFTGLIQLPLPSESWREIDARHSIAKLLDPNGPIDGPCKILHPVDALRILKQF